MSILFILIFLWQFGTTPLLGGEKKIYRHGFSTCAPLTSPCFLLPFNWRCFPPPFVFILYVGSGRVPFSSPSLASLPFLFVNGRIAPLYLHFASSTPPLVPPLFPHPSFSSASTSTLPLPPLYPLHLALPPLLPFTASTSSPFPSASSTS